MSRLPSETLTPREVQIMEVLWARGEATAKQIRAQLPGTPHSSTVRTLLRILKEKKCIRRTVRGKVYVYSPAIRRASAERTALRTVLRRFFHGSAEALVRRLLADRRLTPRHIAKLNVDARGTRRAVGRRSRVALAEAAWVMLPQVHWLDSLTSAPLFS